jgi:hypothetical protein
VAGIGALTQVALGGLGASVKRFERAAETIAQPTPLVGDSVELGSAPLPDKVGATVDMRIQKYAAIANLRVLSTAMELEREVTKIGK